MVDSRAAGRAWETRGLKRVQYWGPWRGRRRWGSRPGGRTGWLGDWECCPCGFCFLDEGRGVPDASEWERVTKLRKLELNVWEWILGVQGLWMICGSGVPSLTTASYSGCLGLPTPEKKSTDSGPELLLGWPWLAGSQQVLTWAWSHPHPGRQAAEGACVGLKARNWGLLPGT